MPARRRRTLSRSPIERAELWDRKMRPDIYATYLESTKPLALPKIAGYQVTHEYLISIVKKALSNKPTESSIMQEYMWYAQKLWKLTQTYRSEALQRQADALYLYYIFRGMDDISLRTIAQALGIKISPLELIVERVMIPQLLKIISEGVVTANSTEQILLEYYGLAVISGYIDLSAMDEEDEIVIRAYVMIEKKGDFKLYRAETFAGRQTEPALYIMPRLTGYGFKITLQQTKGSYKTFRYIFARGV